MKHIFSSTLYLIMHSFNHSAFIDVFINSSQNVYYGICWTYKRMCKHIYDLKKNKKANIFSTLHEKANILNILYRFTIFTTYQSPFLPPSPSSPGVTKITFYLLFLSFIQKFCHIFTYNSIYFLIFNIHVWSNLIFFYNLLLDLLNSSYCKIMHIPHLSLL